MAAVAHDEAFASAGWVCDSTRRYWANPERFGDAIFDTCEVEAIEDGARPDRAKPQRAQRCLCAIPFGRPEEELCWRCGRHIR